MSTEKREGGFGVNGILGSDQCTGMITIKFNNAYVRRYLFNGAQLFGALLFGGGRGRFGFGEVCLNRFGLFWRFFISCRYQDKFIFVQADLQRFSRFNGNIGFRIFNSAAGGFRVSLHLKISGFSRLLCLPM